jgi:hypothetical protein
MYLCINHIMVRKSNPDLWICSQELWPLDHRGSPFNCGQKRRNSHSILYKCLLEDWMELYYCVHNYLLLDPNLSKQNPAHTLTMFLRSVTIITLPSPLCLWRWDATSKTKQTPWSESASDRRLSAKRLPTFADNGCHVVSVTDPFGRILGFLDRSRYFSIK